MAISGGFIEVRDNRVTILADLPPNEAEAKVDMRGASRGATPRAGADRCRQAATDVAPSAEARP
jgi:F0F1-type ATP synthase epsilon subunit